MVIAAASGDRLPLHRLAAATINIGTQRLTEWEARCEIVRRAIEYLERH